MGLHTRVFDSNRLHEVEATAASKGSSLVSAMSNTARATLAVTSICTLATIYFVHYSQQADKDLMHMGVVRDEERQKQRKERMLELERQQALEKTLKQTQTVKET